VDDRALCEYITTRQSAVRLGQRGRARRSGSPSFVVVMQPADVWDCDDGATNCGLGGPRDGRILVQREVSAPLVIVGEVTPKVAVQRALVPHDDVIEALASDGADDAFDERTLPRTTRRRQHFVDAHLLQRTLRIRSVHRIPIADDEARSSIPRPRLAELLRRPQRRRWLVTLMWTMCRRS
jgi:hypothetical protein